MVALRGATAAIGVPYLSRKNQIVSFLIPRWPRMPCLQRNSVKAVLLLSARPRYTPPHVVAYAFSRSAPQCASRLHPSVSAVVKARQPRPPNWRASLEGKSITHQG